MTDTPPESKSSASSDFSNGDLFRDRITAVSRHRVGDYLRNERNPKHYTAEKQQRLTVDNIRIDRVIRHYQSTGTCKELSGFER